MCKVLPFAALALLLSVVAAFASPPDGCKAITVDVTALQHFHVQPDTPLTIRGYGADVAGIQACNPEQLVKAGETNVIGVAASPTAGARIIVRTKAGRGQINLPTALADGDAHQVICIAPEKAGDNPTFRIIRAQWSGGLTESLTFEDTTDKEAADADTNLKGCIAALPPNLRTASPTPAAFKAGEKQQ